MTNTRYPLITFFIFSFCHAFSSDFVNLQFSGPQIIKTLILMEKSENKKVWGTIFSNWLLNWLNWHSTPCAEEIRWSQSRNRHSRKFWGTYFLNTVFFISFLIQLTSQDTPYFPSQSKLVRISLGVNGNKIESFRGKYNSKYSKFGLVKVPMPKIPWCSLHFFQKICSSMAKVCWKVIQFMG